MLNDKQNAFCREYVTGHCNNGTQSAIAAGYSEKTAAVQASRLLKNKEVLERIKEYQKEKIEQSCLTEERLVNELLEILERCMSAVPVMEWSFEEHEYVPTGEYQFDSKGALNAIKLLGARFGMFDKKMDDSAANKQIEVIFTEKLKEYAV